MYPSYTLTILVTLYIMNGMGILLSLLVLAMYFHRLTVHHLPAREVIVSCFLPLGTFFTFYHVSARLPIACRNIQVRYVDIRP